MRVCCNAVLLDLGGGTRVLSSYIRHLHDTKLRVLMTGTEYVFPHGHRAPEAVGSELEAELDGWFEAKDKW